MQADVTLHRSFTVAPVPRRLFGSFVEQTGRCVCGGIYEPGHPTADDIGFRDDVLELAHELGVQRRQIRPGVHHHLDAASTSAVGTTTSDTRHNVTSNMRRQP